MAGYNFTSWKSNNAIAAEDRGLVKAGALARMLNVSSAAVKCCIAATEWHHVSGGFTETDYYDPDRVHDYDLDKARDFDKRARPISFLHCDVQWLEWPKFKVGRYARNNGRPRVVDLRGAHVTRSSPNTFIIHAPDGPITKRATTKGLVITWGDVVVVDNSQRR